MTVKDIIKISATQIGREDVVDYLDGKTTSASEQTVKDVDRLLRLCNLVINELACSFIPMRITQTLNSEDGKVYYENLNFNPLEILAVYDSNGKDVMGKVYSRFVTVTEKRVTVEYSCFPPKYQLEDEIGYTPDQIPERVLSYGLSAEFAISEGCFKDAVMWHDRYADAVYNLCKPKNQTVKKRVWQ